MRIAQKNGVKRIIIDPGEYFVSREPLVISTLLGSCVSACLYDPYHRVAGMNHFLLASKRYTRDIPVIESEAGRYGIHAMELLINEMLKQGAQRENLKAKVFGGGDVLRFLRGERDNFYDVGEMNCRFVREFLRNEKIPILASDLGGDYGRVIHFRCDDYCAYMKKITPAQDVRVINTEHDYWQQTIDEHAQDKPRTEFW